MKNLTAIVLMFVIALSSFTISKAGFTGKWGTSTKTSDFELTLKQTGSTITGSHVSVMQNGNRLDAGADEKGVTITGVINKAELATVTFTSGYTNKTGTATIKLIAGNKLEWNIVKEPQGEYYIPKHAILSREKK